jgi:hypothetical protein
LHTEKGREVNSLEYWKEKREFPKSKYKSTFLQVLSSEHNDQLNF